MKTKAPKDYLKDPYTFALIRDDDGTYAAAVEEFEGCFSQGRTADEAMINVLAAAENWIEAMLANGKAIPPPKVTYEVSGKFALRMPKSLHEKVQSMAKRDDVSVNTFLIEAIAEKVGAIAYGDRQMANLELRMAKKTVANLAAMLLPSLSWTKSASTDVKQSNVSGQSISININQQEITTTE